ncbi:MAG TPA: endo-1,3-alpha-glucanase family glycosylhydrolase [Acetobacteraceae bacterium]|nr:endo-1,3-alpha-glucanase family glycosylhydrolase [Acetobacteraceae bacterium]
MSWAMPTARAQPWPGGMQQPSRAEWRTIREIAERFVDRESPPGVWPFRNPSRAVLASSPRTTFAHYFPPYPLSLDNLPAGRDTYNDALLDPAGARGRFTAIGGYLRDRPLPVGPWKSRDWREIDATIEILRAERVGIDGFACDLLRVAPEHQFNAWDEINLLMRTAEAVAPRFRIVIAPDSVALRSVSAPRLAAAIAALARYPSAGRLKDGRLLLAPFAPETMGADYWHAVLDDLESRGMPAAFIPVLLGWRRAAAEFAPISDAMSAWGERDADAVEDGAFDGFETAMAPYTALAMMPVGPQDVRPKTERFWESRNADAYRLLWMRAIAHGVRFVQIVTWNDYSETSAIAPSAGTQFLFYDLTAYFNDWYKTGAPPAILRDAIAYSERTEIIPPNTGSTAGAPMERMGRTPLCNRIQMLAFLTAPASLEIALGDQIWHKDASAGLAVFSIPAKAGRPIFTIVRGGRVVLRLTSAWEIHPSFTIENPAYLGGSSTRPFTAVPPFVGNPNG